jgi:hypothetical protein
VRREREREREREIRQTTFQRLDITPLVYEQEINLHTTANVHAVIITRVNIKHSRHSYNYSHHCILSICSVFLFLLFPRLRLPLVIDIGIVVVARHRTRHALWQCLLVFRTYQHRHVVFSI